MEERGQLFLVAEFQLINVKGKEEYEKSLLGKHHSNRFSRKDLLMGDRISGQKFQKKQDLHSLYASSPKYLQTTMAKPQKNTASSNQGQCHQ